MGLLRFLLAVSVVCAHCGSFLGRISFVGGEIAVQSFFIISGFYMSLVLDKKYDASSSFSNYKLFITNRLLRLYPIYWVILILTIAGFFVGDASKLSDFRICNLPSLIYLLFVNIFIFFQDTIMFLGINVKSGGLFYTSNFHETSPLLYNFLFVPQGWSLGIELLFYLVAPFLVSKRSSVIVTLIILSLFCRVLIFNYFNLNHDPWTYRFFPTEVLFFLIGIISQRYSSQTDKIPIKPLMMLIFMVAFTTVYIKLPGISFAHFPFSIKSMLYFILISLSIPKLFSAFKDNKIDRYIGELSYPIYTSHMLVFYVTRHHFFEGFNSGSFVVVYSVLISIMLVKYVSEPIEKYRQARVRDAKPFK
jgi:peptidoglycan/LPS O-acetylase OafA/YrhL